MLQIVIFNFPLLFNQTGEVKLLNMKRLNKAEKSQLLNLKMFW